MTTPYLFSFFSTRIIIFIILIFDPGGGNGRGGGLGGDMGLLQD